MEGIVGNRFLNFFLMEAKKLPSLSQQAGGSETEQIGIYTYIDYVPILPSFVTVCLISVVTTTVE